ncbi:MAG TPA: hypothetical protein DEA55_05905 [Rhodospirillaceae bacterium]|nr:hypothetical protein [Rhodospirillaceae bacterium]
MTLFHSPISGTYNDLASPRESASGAVALLSGSADGDNSHQDHFSLEAGKTSLIDRVANLAKQGRTFDVVNLLETVLKNSDERTVGIVAKIALDAYDRMEPSDAKNVLKDVLADWGMDADNRPAPPRPSFTVALLSPLPR